jgi:hypothetical protein
LAVFEGCVCFGFEMLGFQTTVMLFVVIWGERGRREG